MPFVSIVRTAPFVPPIVGFASLVKRVWCKLDVVAIRAFSLEEDSANGTQKQRSAPPKTAPIYEPRRPSDNKISQTIRWKRMEAFGKPF